MELLEFAIVASVLRSWSEDGRDGGAEGVVMAEVVEVLVGVDEDFVAISFLTVGWKVATPFWGGRMGP